MSRKLLIGLAVVALSGATFAQTYVNGPFITHPGAFVTCGAPAPGNGSSLETAAPLLLGTFGYTASTAFRLADDFTVPAGQAWTVTSFRVYAYQTGSTTTSTFTQGNYKVWCGTPGAGGTIVADFSAANQLVGTAFTNTFRATAATIGNCTTGNTRPIMQIDLNGNGLTLQPGTYWLDYQLVGMLASGPFSPPISILGTGATGNARQQTVAGGTWANVGNGTSTLWPTGLPFEVNYLVGASLPPQWEANDAFASLDLDGLQANSACQAAISNKCPGTHTTITLASSLTAGWDVAISSLPLVPASAGGLVTPGGQTINVNITDPTLTFLNGFSFPPFPVPFGLGSPVVLPLATPPIPSLSIQMLVLDATHPDGFRLSQGAQLNGTAVAAPQPGPAGDDASITVDLTGVAPVCGGPVTLFGTAYTRAYMTSNGRVSFIFENNDFSPTTAEALANYPSVSPLWADLSPQLGGPCDVQTGGTAILPAAVQPIFPAPATSAIQFRWTNAPLFGTATPVSVYAIYIYNDGTGASGQWVLHQQTGVPASVAAAFIGLSRGNTGATDPGAQAFAASGSGPAAPSPTAMLYNFGTVGSVYGTAQTIVFTPVGGASGAGGYSWLGY